MSCTLAHVSACMPAGWVPLRAKLLLRVLARAEPCQKRVHAASQPGSVGQVRELWLHVLLRPSTYICLLSVYSLAYPRLWLLESFFRQGVSCSLSSWTFSCNLIYFDADLCLVHLLSRLPQRDRCYRRQTDRERTRESERQRERERES